MNQNYRDNLEKNITQAYGTKILQIIRTFYLWNRDHQRFDQGKVNVSS